MCDSAGCFIFNAAPTPPAARLFCFPSAGSGASFFHGWDKQLLPGLEVRGVQLPGRESRSDVPPLADVRAIIDDLMPAFVRTLDRPFALFGHSMGAIVAFELARELRRRRLPQPSALFVSARVAPHHPAYAGTDKIADAVLIDRLRSYGGTSDELFAEPGLIEYLLPLLRTDIAVSEMYTYYAEPPLAIPLIVFGGADDPFVPTGALPAWAAHTSEQFTVQLFPGAHFFVRSERDAVLASIGRQMASALSNLARHEVTP